MQDVLENELETVNVALLKRLYAWAVSSQQSLDKFWAKNPEFAAEHKQSAWGTAIKNGTCRTAFCLAGQVAVVNDFVFVLDFDDWVGQDTYDYDDSGHREADGEYMVRKEKVHALGMKFVGKSGRTFAYMPTREVAGRLVGRMYQEAYATHIPMERRDFATAREVAQNVLGIEGWEANELFNGDNEVDTIGVIINAIFERRELPYRVSEDEVWEQYADEPVEV